MQCIFIQRKFYMGVVPFLGPRDEDGGQSRMDDEYLVTRH